MAKKKAIKLIIIDLYGVMSLGSYRDTCQWLCRKYGLDYDACYRIIYHKNFSRAVARRISERQAFDLTAKELGIKETGRELRAKHLSFQKLNKPVFNFAKQLRGRGYKILLLSKNTPSQFNEVAGRFGLKKYFTVINTYYLKISKESPQLIRYVLKRYRLEPEEIVMIDDQDFNLSEPKKIGVYTILYQDFSTFKKKITAILKD